MDNAKSPVSSIQYGFYNSRVTAIAVLSPEMRLALQLTGNTKGVRKNKIRNPSYCSTRTSLNRDAVVLL